MIEQMKKNDKLLKEALTITNILANVNKFSLMEKS